MSDSLARLEEAVKTWYEEAKTELEAEASFLEKIAEDTDDITLAETRIGERFSDLIADTIAELMGS